MEPKDETFVKTLLLYSIYLLIFLKILFLALFLTNFFDQCEQTWIPPKQATTVALMSMDNDVSRIDTTLANHRLAHDKT